MMERECCGESWWVLIFRNKVRLGTLSRRHLKTGIHSEKYGTFGTKLRKQKKFRKKGNEFFTNTQDNTQPSAQAKVMPQYK